MGLTVRLDQRRVEEGRWIDSEERHLNSSRHQCVFLAIIVEVIIVSLLYSMLDYDSQVFRCTLCILRFQSPRQIVARVATKGRATRRPIGWHSTTMMAVSSPLSPWYIVIGCTASPYDSHRSLRYKGTPHSHLPGLGTFNLTILVLLRDENYS